MIIYDYEYFMIYASNKGFSFEDISEFYDYYENGLTHEENLDKLRARVREERIENNLEEAL